MTEPVNFKAIGDKVKLMAADGVPLGDIDGYVRAFGTDLATVNASGFGIKDAAATPATPPPSGWRSAGIGATQGLTANFGDEIASGIAATIGRPGGEAIPGATWGDRYQNALDIARPQQKAAQEAHPYIYGGAQVAGAVLPSLVAPEAFGSTYIANAPTLTQAAIRSGQIGSLYGGISAFGNAEGDAATQAKETATGAGAGAVIGAAIPPLVAGATKLGTWAWNAAKGMFTPAETVIEPATVNAAADAAEALRPRATIDAGQTDKSMAVNKIAQALRRDGYSIDDIQRMLDAAGPDATLADLGKNTQQLLTSSMGAPGPAKQIGSTILENRQAGEQGRLLDATTKALGGGSGFHETDDALLQRLEKEASPLYDKAFAEAQPVDISGVLDQIDTGLAKVPQKSPIRAAVERVKSMLLEEVKGAEGKTTNAPYSDLETLHNAKLAIDDMLSNYGGENSLGNVSKRQITQIKNALLEAMDASNSAYAEARSKFSGIMTSRDALAAGRAFIKSDAEITASALRDMAPEDQQFFREGAKRALADIIKSKPSDVSVVQLLRKTGLLEKVEALAPSEGAFKAFVQDLSNARRFAATRAAATGGSQSVEKALGAADLAGGMAQIGQAANGNPAGLVARSLNWLGRLVGPGEETRAMIAKRLLQGPGPQRDELLKALAYAQRLQALSNNAGSKLAIGGSSLSGPAAGGIGIQP